MPKYFSPRLILIAIVVLASILRFYNLMWGNGDFFNPDERNMAAAVSQFRLPKNPQQLLLCLSSEFQPNNHTADKPDRPINETTDCNLNPHFFAYGQFPLYLAYGSGIIADNLFFNNIPQETIAPSSNQLLFPKSIFWLRFWSATTSVLTVFFVYSIVKALFSQKSLKVNSFQRTVLALCGALLFTCTPGSIQSAHFGTTESMLTFFFMMIIYLALKLVQTNTEKNTQESFLYVFNVSAFFAVIMGVALGTKISALAFAPPFFLALIFNTIRSLKSKHTLKALLASLVRYFNVWIFIIFLTSTVTILASPYNIMELQDFRSAINFETSVAQGLKVFYTRQFEHTTPIIFQIGSIFPYALGPGLFVLGTVGGLLITAQLAIEITKSLITKKTSSFMNPSVYCSPFSIVIVAFFIYFLPTSFLYTKWTRFMNPIFPFFSLFTIVTLYYGWNTFLSIRNKTILDTYPATKRILTYGIIGMFLGICFQLLAPGLAYVHIYAKEDVRTSASRWIYKHIPSEAHVLSETGNVIDIPTGFSQFAINDLQPTSYTLNPVSFDFYQLDENPTLHLKLIDELEKAEYIFIPSRRLFFNSMRISDQLPILTRYYNALFSGMLGFEEIATFTSFPSLYGTNHKPLDGVDSISYDQGVKNALTASTIFLTKGYLPDEGAEETWSVFDHPVIRIYKKMRPLTRDQYELLVLNQPPF